METNDHTENAVEDVNLNWTKSLEAAKPNQQWMFYVFEDNKLIGTQPLHHQSAYLIGRNKRVADIVVDHPLCSEQHAVVQFRKLKHRGQDGVFVEKVLPYLLDLKSAQKTFVNGKAVEDSIYFELRERDRVKFGASSCDYVLARENNVNNFLLLWGLLMFVLLLLFSELGGHAEDLFWSWYLK